MVCASFQHLYVLSQQNVTRIIMLNLGWACAVTASRVVIHNKLAASWAGKTHSRVGKYRRTPCGRTHPKCSSHPAALRISGVQSLQLQVSHQHSANSMKSLGISVSKKIYKGERMLSALCSQRIVRL